MVTNSFSFQNCIVSDKLLCRVTGTSLVLLQLPFGRFSVLFGRLAVEGFVKSVVVKKTFREQRRLTDCSWCLQ